MSPIALLLSPPVRPLTTHLSTHPSQHNLPDSLFGSDSDSEDGVSSAQSSPCPSCPLPGPDLSPPTRLCRLLASPSCPFIPGLFHLPAAVPASLQASLASSLSASAFPAGSNQVMLFGLASFPPSLAPLLAALPAALEAGGVPAPVRAAFWADPNPLQAIVNVYPPGAGISPHVDLPHRYGPIVLGLSLLAPVAFEFRKVAASAPRAPAAAFDALPGPGPAPEPASPSGNDEGDGAAEPVTLWLRPGDVYVLSGEARACWAHGIAAREADWVEEEDGDGVREVRRRLRMSITLRRAKAGALVVGGA